MLLSRPSRFALNATRNRLKTGPKQRSNKPETTGPQRAYSLAFRLLFSLCPANDDCFCAASVCVAGLVVERVPVDSLLSNDVEVRPFVFVKRPLCEVL